jgi:peptidoglycan/xylan/chitin deacetylase (PgdA/CDA1 family)
MKWWLILQCSGLTLIGLSLLIGADYTLLGCLFFLCGNWVVLAHIFLPRSQGLCDVVTRFETKGKEVWLTIDDGPDPVDTPAILQALAQHGAKATFFMIGTKAANHPELVDQVLASGHSIGTHTQTHPLRSYWAAGRQRVCRELDDSLAALHRQAHPLTLYRSPVGIKNIFLRRALKERDLQYVAWSIRSGDALSHSVEAVVRRVEKELLPGAILLMHEGCGMHSEVRVEAIRAVLTMLSQRGYRCMLPQPESYIT